MPQEDLLENVVEQISKQAEEKGRDSKDEVITGIRVSCPKPIGWLDFNKAIRFSSERGLDFGIAYLQIIRETKSGTDYILISQKESTSAIF